jgi:DnaJ family protein A protein 2
MKLYDTLNISKDCHQNDIKKAYRKLAMKEHPDKGGSQEKFKEINEAYSILSDPQKRKAYDNGQLDDNGNQNMQHGFDPFDIFSNFFRHEDTNFNFQNTRQKHDNRPKHIKLKISLEDLYTGKQTTINIPRNSCCPCCQGVGSNQPPIPCNECNGVGKIRKVLQLGPGIIQQIIGECPKCNGNGKYTENQHLCKVCNGNKLIEETTTIKLDIKKGTAEQEKIIMQGYGDYNLNTLTYNDLILVIEQKPHNRIKRNGNDLVIEQVILLKDALTGANFEYTHLNNKKYNFKTNEIVTSDSIFVAYGIGMSSKHNRFGDLYIKFNILFPDELILNPDDSFNNCLESSKQIPEGEIKYLSKAILPTESKNQPTQCAQQ